MQLNAIQQEFKDLVDRKAVFDVRGCSLFCNGREYPIAMAKHIGIKPRVIDYGLLDKAWSKA